MQLFPNLLCARPVDDAGGTGAAAMPSRPCRPGPPRGSAPTGAPLSSKYWGGRRPSEVDSSHATPISVTLNSKNIGWDASRPPPPPSAEPMLTTYSDRDSATVTTRFLLKAGDMGKSETLKPTRRKHCLTPQRNHILEIAATTKNKITNPKNRTFRLWPQGRAQGGRAKGARPFGVFGPLRAEGPRGPKLLRRHPKPTQKSRNLCGNPPKKHVRTVEGLLTIWVHVPRKQAHQKNRTLLSIRGPSEHQGPLWASGAPLGIRGSSEPSGAPLSHQGPSERPLMAT